MRHFGEKDFRPEYLAQHGAVVQSLMNHYRKERLNTIGQGELGIIDDDPMMNVVHRVIRAAVRVLTIPPQAVIVLEQGRSCKMGAIQAALNKSGPIGGNVI